MIVPFKRTEPGLQTVWRLRSVERGPCKRAVHGCRRPAAMNVDERHRVSGVVEHGRASRHYPAVGAQARAGKARAFHAEMQFGCVPGRSQEAEGQQPLAQAPAIAHQPGATRGAAYALDDVADGQPRIAADRPGVRAGQQGIERLAINQGRKQSREQPQHGAKSRPHQERRVVGHRSDDLDDALICQIGGERQKVRP